MTIHPMLLVVEPSRISPELPISHNLTPAREFYHCDKFAEELRRYTAAPVTLIEDFLSHVPLDGFVLLFASADLDTVFNECTEELRETLTQRLISVAVNRTQIWPQLTEYKLPAVIDYQQYFLWDEAVEGTGGWNEAVEDIGGCTLNGLYSVAIHMGSNIFRKRGDYCVLESKPAETLPAFLIRYLEEYTKICSLT